MKAKCTGAVLYKLGTIRLQPDTYGVSNLSFAVEIDLHLMRHYAATAVSTDNVFGADPILLILRPIANHRIDSIRDLVQLEQLMPHTNLSAVGFRSLRDNRLKHMLVGIAR
jgi:hypothetical protein